MVVASVGLAASALLTPSLPPVFQHLGPRGVGARTWKSLDTAACNGTWSTWRPPQVLFAVSPPMLRPHNLHNWFDNVAPVLSE